MNYDQELHQLIRLSKKLRTAQKHYFANRKSPNWQTYLNKAKSIESEFDSKLKQLEIDLTQSKLGI